MQITKKRAWYWIVAFILFMSLLPGISYAQNGFDIGEGFANNQQTACVPVWAHGLSNVTGFQFSISWDPALVTLDSVGNLNVEGLSNNSFGFQFVDEGLLSVLWTDDFVQGVNLEDNLVFNLYFSILTSDQNPIPIQFSNEPTSIYAFSLDGINIIEFIPSTEDGAILFIPSFSLIDTIIQPVNCFGGMNGEIVLNIDGGIPPYTFNWSTNATEIDSNRISGLVAGIYSVIIEDSIGNIFIDSFEINQPTPLIVNSLELPSLDCVDTLGIVSIVIEGGTGPYKFFLDSIENQTGIFESIGVGLDTITVTDNNDCEIMVPFQISPPEEVSLSLIGNTFSCTGPIVISAITDAIVFEWYLDNNLLNQDEEEIEALSSGLYTILVTDENQCQAQDSILIEIAEPIEITASIDNITPCLGDAINIELSGGARYFDMEGNLIEEDEEEISFEYIVTDSGFVILQFIGEDSAQCYQDTSIFELMVFMPQGFAGADTCIIAGQKVQLNAFGGVSYQWSNDNFVISNENIANPSSFPEKTTTYFVEIIDEQSCIRTDSIQVLVASNPFEFIKPINVITPNGDNWNDTLEFENLEKYGINKLVVVNRWGNEVFSKLNYQNDWNGTYNGEPLPSGIYYYVLTIGDEKLKSSLTIIQE